MKRATFKGEGSSIFTNGKTYNILAELETGSIVVVDDKGKNSLMFKTEYNLFEEDSIVESVLSRFKQRSEAGIKKYNTTLDRTDLSTLDWITAAQEEAMDFCLYLERLKKEFAKN